jgi:hypothetical protein
MDRTLRNVTRAGGLTRRRFLAAAALPLASLARSAEPGAGRPSTPFAFVALGDMHFDRPEHHDMDWLRRDHPNDVPQVENYSRITREVTPGLLREVRRTASATDVPVRFVAQLGDLVEGMCGAPGLARRQCEEAVALIRGAELGVPFFAAKGNHEIQGPGAADAFDRVLLPVLGGRERRDRGPASFTIEEGDGLFAFLDAYDRGALDWLERTLAARTARHLFVLLHPPVVPFGARSTWHLYARAADAPLRKRLLDLLGAHRAIVLCAHLHKFGVVVRETGSGRFLQLALCSVLPRADIRARDEVEGVDRFGPDLVKLEPRFSPETEAVRREVLRAEAPFIKHYEYADAPGFALVTVSGEGVRADVHVGLERAPWKRLDLTALLSGS